MLIPADLLARHWGINPKGILHVGAHEAEEREAYKALDWGEPYVWVEAQSSRVQHLAQNLPVSDVIIHGAAWNQSGELLELKITNNSQSSSLLELGIHASMYPEVVVTSTEVVKTIRLDDVLSSNTSIEMMVLDIQGAELQALQGAERIVSQIKWIYTEVNKRKLYTGCCLVSDIDNFLQQYGFKRVQTRWVRGKGWGDAIYIRRELIPSYWRKSTVDRYLFSLEYELRQRVGILRWIPKEFLRVLKSWLS
jgi:FkbM family methyltransferase